MTERVDGRVWGFERAKESCTDMETWRPLCHGQPPLQLGVHEQGILVKLRKQIQKWHNCSERVNPSSGLSMKTLGG